jgi:nitrate reductase beta subunit
VFGVRPGVCFGVCDGCSAYIGAVLFASVRILRIRDVEAFDDVSDDVQRVLFIPAEPPAFMIVAYTVDVLRGVG